MFKRIAKYGFLVIFISAVILGADFGFAKEAGAANLNLKGRILLQVQDKGQAWYINPLNGKRYSLGHPDDAFKVMRALGLGVSNADLSRYLVKAPASLSGRILLKVQDKGQAYYVDPVELKLYYLGRPADAFQVMRKRGLGISTKDLLSIPSASSISTSISIPVKTTSPVVAATSVSPVDNGVNKQFSFKYQNTSFEVIQPLSLENLREVFYGVFLRTKSDDKSIDEIISKLKAQAAQNKWTDDQLLEFTLSFIQYIPYDHDKVTQNSGVNTNPYFPYETLYLDKGVCSDKTFLGVLLLRKLGYGAAILDFPDINHTALGVECPKEYSINNSGYCYAETTNYFPLGIIPQSISNGQAQTANEFDTLFNSTKLGKIEIYQTSSGKSYGGMPALVNKINSLKNTKADISTRSLEINNLANSLNVKEKAVTDLRTQIDNLYNNGQISAYNQQIAGFNAAVISYNSDLAVYQTKINEYNQEINSFNTSVHAFYQQ
jgi:hypothetical protein